MTRLSLYLTILFFSIQTLPAQVYVDVNATGANDGSSWADALTNLNYALSTRPENAHFYVKEGTYTPDDGTADRDSRFQPKWGQKIFGGFPNSMSNPTFGDRDADAYETILSGEIGAAGNADNSIHVVVISDVYDVILDGLTIQDGNANDDSFFLGHQGGGLVVIYWDAVTPLSPPAQIVNTKFKNNEATWGGGGCYLRAVNNGVALSTFETIFNSCIFEDNMSGNVGGGLMLHAPNDCVGNASLNNCQFNNNTATNNGGGCDVAADNGGNDNSTFTNCTFSQNKVVNYTGAGIRLNGYSGTITTTLTGCTFSDNGDSSLDEQWHGGAIALSARQNGLVTANISNCTFTDNYCRWDGGAIYLNGEEGGNCSPTISDCNFTDNTAQYGGGAGIFMFADGIGGEASPNISNCNFSGGTTVNGGGICLWADSNGDSKMHPVIDNCDFDTNTAEDGGGMYVSGWNDTDVKPSISNCTFTSNIATHNGGGVANFGSDKSAGAPLFKPTYTDCKFNNNTAPLGGGSYNTGHNSTAAGLCKPRYERCTFIDNSATDFYSGSFKAGSAAYNNGYGGFVEAEYENCIMIQFDNSSEGALVLCRGTSGGADNSTFIHCTLESSQEVQVLYKDYSDAHFYNSVLKGSSLQPAENVPYEAPADYSDNGVVFDFFNALGNNTNVGPSFQYSWPTDANYEITSCSSSAIDRPNPPTIALPALDFHQKERVGVNDANRYPDAGAIEFGARLNSPFNSVSGQSFAANLRLFYPDDWSYLAYCDGPGLYPILGIKDLDAAAIPGQNGFNVTSYDRLAGIVDLSNADYVTNPDGFEVFERNWDVESPYLVPAGGQAVRFFYDPFDLSNIQSYLGVNNAEDLAFFKLSGAGIEPYDECVLACGGSYNEYTFAPDGVATTDKYIYGELNPLSPYAEYKVTSFSGGGGGGAPGGGGALLPLELQSLRGIRQAKNNKIVWTTLMEDDVQYHIVERSKNGIDDWSEIERLNSKGNAINSQSYEALDNNPFPLSYYRLRFVDFSGEAQLSEIISIKREYDISWEVAPNPAKDFFNIKISSAKETDIQIRITDVLGRVLWQDVKSLAATDSEIQLGNLDWERGIYFVNIEINGETQVRKLILD